MGDNSLSKRNKRKNKKSELTPEQLKLQANQALSNAHYKLAIQHLKALLKKEGESESLFDLLQQAYTGRAEELADMGMTTEAIAIWDVATQYGLDPVDPRYLDWILSSHQYFRLTKIYQQLRIEDKRHLQPQLAAICLSGDLSVLKALPEDDPVCSGYEVANALLQAWCSGESEAQLHQRMKAIAFRSPYRDLRQIIQTWLLLEKSPNSTDTGKGLEKIAKTSPFYPLAEQLRLAQLETSDLLVQLSSLSANSRNCAVEIRSWSDKQTLNLLKKLEKLDTDPKIKILSNTLLGLSRQFANEQFPPAVKYWLYSITKKVWAISEKNAFSKLNFTKLSRAVGDLTILEENYYGCLSSISNQEPPNYLVKKIKRYLDELKVTTNKEVEKKDRLLISALMCRYLVDQLKNANSQKLSAQALEFLKQLVDDDPSDHESWEELLEYHLQQKKLKLAREILNKALKYHPNNIKILDLAVRIAIAGNTFVKATNYAKRILAVDPINSSAQQYLQQAHLSHARKQIKQKKWHLVDKELKEVARWKGTVLSNLLLEVLKAYQIQAEKGGEVATEAFQSLAKKRSVDKVALDFVIRHQAIQINQNDKIPLRNAKLVTLWNTPSKQHVLSLIDIIQQLRKINPNSINKVLKNLFKPLKKAAKLSFSEKEGEQICEFWMQTKEDDLLHEYSDQLRRQHDDKPLFIYYYFVNSNLYHSGAFELVETAWEEAKDDGDEALSARLVGLLQKCPSPFSNPFGGGGNPFFDDEEDDWGWGESDPDDLKTMMDAMEAVSMIDEDDVQGHGNIMADLISMIPLKEVIKLAGEMFGKDIPQIMLSQYGEEKLRSFCSRCLKGEDPEDVIIDMGITIKGLI